MDAPQIVSDPAVMMGKPVVAGTRITVELLLDKLAAGESAEQIQRAHPHLPPGAIRSALAYAAAVVRNEVVVPLGRTA
ncbi:MAG: DUF433 domain-containing protein [Gemmataceae bacterium]|nr:DUF433 domain-containing protein [Gemmataceae bacterium]